jgi:hypothetical protein
VGLYVDRLPTNDVMRRTATLAVVAIVLVGTLSVTVPVAAQSTATDADPTVTDGNATATTAANATTTADGTATGDASEETDGDETDENETAGNESAAPGARLGGVVGMQRAGLEGELEARTFGLAVARANSENGRVAVVARQYTDLEQRLANLTEQKRELQRAHANGSLSTAQFRAEMAVLHERTQTVRRLSNETANASEGLPVEQLEARGVNATAIQRLKQNASDLTGPEVSAIARSIAGRSHGRAQGVALGANGTFEPTEANDTRGPPENVTQGPSGNDTRGPGGNTGGQSGSGSADGGTSSRKSL